MKKKIRELTFEESKKICDNEQSCYGCPLQLGEENDGTVVCLREKRIHKILEQEIEVEDEL